MKKKVAIFDLIQSLTKNEKRLFKIYASRHSIGGKNNYVKLFDAIASMEKYDEDKLLRKLCKESATTFFASEKNYLYNLILDFLDVYHNESTTDRQISKYLNIAKVLYDKQLYEQSKKIIDKSLALIEEHDRFEYVFPMLTLLKNIEYDRDDLSETRLKFYYGSMLSTINMLTTKIKYNQISDELILKRRLQGPVKDSTSFDTLKTIYKNPYFRDNSMVNSLSSNVYYLLGKLEYFRYLREFKKCEVYCKKIISIFEKSPGRIIDFVNIYIYTLGCYSEICQNLNKKNEALEGLEKLKKVPEMIGSKNLTNAIELKTFEMYYVSITDFCLNKREYQMGLQYVKAIEEGLSKYGSRITPYIKMGIISNVAFLYFGNGEYKLSLKWCNLIYNNPPINAREDTICFNKILYLLIHLELKNNLILPSIIKSTYRFLYKRNRVYQFETILLKYLKKLYTADSRKQQKNLLLEFKDELEPLERQKFENAIFNEIDLIGWINKKVNSTS